MSMKGNNVHASHKEEERMPLVPTRVVKESLPMNPVGWRERMNTDEPGEQERTLLGRHVSVSCRVIFVADLGTGCFKKSHVVVSQMGVFVD